MWDCEIFASWIVAIEVETKMFPVLQSVNIHSACLEKHYQFSIELRKQFQCWIKDTFLFWWLEEHSLCWIAKPLSVLLWIYIDIYAFGRCLSNNYENFQCIGNVDSVAQ